MKSLILFLFVTFCRSELSDTDSINRLALLEDAVENLQQANYRLETKMAQIQYEHSEMQRESLQQKDEIKLLRQENDRLSSRVVLLEHAIPSLVTGQLSNGTSQNKRVLPFTTNPVNVAFHANVNGHIGLNDNEVIRFDRVNTNLESSYDGNTGLFQAPTPGYYVFFVHFLVLAQKRLEARIVKNGNLIQSAFAGTQDVGQGPGSNLAIVRLVQVDRIWIKVHEKYHDTGDILDGPWCTFSGFLLYPEV
ncbi:CAPRIN2 [Mytilus coruscus]|uniref:CAPRIN2 n=1 Tax=Mytilus coruscus TaxID=42192 RepID=A0A6J8C1R5_MYTCO|nr:CAPRIN2 [Mytilus coruscus]